MIDYQPRLQYLTRGLEVKCILNVLWFWIPYPSYSLAQPQKRLPLSQTSAYCAAQEILNFTVFAWVKVGIFSR